MHDTRVDSCIDLCLLLGMQSLAFSGLISYNMYEYKLPNLLSYLIWYNHIKILLQTILSLKAMISKAG